jgi:hypothetical protein
MTDDFDRRLRDWMHDDGDVTADQVSRVAATVSSLPSRSRRRLPAWRGAWVGLAAAAVLVVVLVTAGILVFFPRGGLVGGTPRGGNLPPISTPSPTPSSKPAPTAPDPAAFSGDHRLAGCSANDPSRVEFAFEMRHAADYHRHLPAMLMAPELDVPDPAFVAIYREGFDSGLPIGGAAPPPGQTWPPRSFAPGHRDLCIVVGADLNLYADVDIAGMQATLPGDVAASPSAPVMHHAARLTYLGKTVDIASASDCDALTMSAFYQAFCRYLAAERWSDIPATDADIGLTPPMLARLTRASLDGDTSICPDPLTIRYVRAGSRSAVDDQAAIATCEASIRSFQTAGNTIIDPTSTDNSAPLAVAPPSAGPAPSSTIDTRPTPSPAPAIIEAPTEPRLTASPS